MSSGNIQIVAAYEQAGLAPEDIAEQFGWEVEAVKAVLMSCSKVFYARVVAQEKTTEDPSPNIANEEAPLFNSQEVDEAKRAIAMLVTSTEDDHIKLMASKFVINEAKGRHDVKTLKHATFNISLINDRMLKAKQVQAKAIEISSKILEAQPA